MKTVLILLSSLCSISSAFAQFYSAQSLSMGTTGVCIPDAFSYTENPAALGLHSQYGSGVRQQLFHPQKAAYTSEVFALRQMSSFSTLAVSFSYFGDREFRDLRPSVHAGFKIANKANLGAGLSYLHLAAPGNNNERHGVQASLGSLVNIYAGLYTGASVKYLYYTSANPNDVEIPFRLLSSAGISYSHKGKFTGSAAIHYEYPQKIAFGVGTEFTFQKLWQLRCGFGNNDWHFDFGAAYVKKGVRTELSCKYNLMSQPQVMAAISYLWNAKPKVQ